MRILVSGMEAGELGDSEDVEIEETEKDKKALNVVYRPVEEGWDSYTTSDLILILTTTTFILKHSLNLKRLTGKDRDEIESVLRSRGDWTPSFGDFIKKIGK